MNASKTLMLVSASAMLMLAMQANATDPNSPGPRHRSTNSWADCKGPGLVGTQVGSLVTYHFKGQLDEQFGTLPPGTAFSGTLSYAYPQVSIGSSLVRGDYVSESFSLEIGTEQIVREGRGGTIHVYDAPTYPADMLSYYNVDAISGTIGGETLQSGAGAILIFQDLTGTTFSSIALPGPSLTMADLTQGQHPALATFLELRSTGLMPGFPPPTDFGLKARGRLCGE